MVAVVLLNQSRGALYEPPVEDGVEWRTEISGSPGELNYTYLYDGHQLADEGDAVSLRVDGQNVFFGFCFQKSGDSATPKRAVKAYDQLRYLKNKDTYLYENKTAADFIQMLARDFNLQAGALADTGYRIPSRIEDDQTLFDMIQNALDLTMQNTGQLHVLFDDFGRLTLKSLEDMRVPILLDEETGQTVKFSSSIDNETYNKIKLTRDNEETGLRDVYIAQDSGNINKWGMLQYYEKLQDGENGAFKADALLKLYNQKRRQLSLNDFAGDLRVRAGSLVLVRLSLGDFVVSNWFLVVKCKHTFRQNGDHRMSLDLRGGEFNV